MTPTLEPSLEIVNDDDHMFKKSSYLTANLENIQLMLTL